MVLTICFCNKAQILRKFVGIFQKIIVEGTYNDVDFVKVFFLLYNIALVNIGEHESAEIVEFTFEVFALYDCICPFRISYHIVYHVIDSFSVTFAEEIDAFVGALRFEREMAENTCVAYERDLRDFAAAQARRGKSSAAELAREDIADYLRAERDAGRRSSTRARHAVAIRMWLRFLKAVRNPPILRNTASLTPPALTKPGSNESSAAR